MTEPTRYITFKLNRSIGYLRGPIATVLDELMHEPEGLTFEELWQRTHLGPQHLRAILGELFGRDYIITNHQVAKLREKYGTDFRRFEP